MNNKTVILARVVFVVGGAIQMLSALFVFWILTLVWFGIQEARILTPTALLVLLFMRFSKFWETYGWARRVLQQRGK